MNRDEYYLQDNRCPVGNSALWWKKDRAGYTTDLREAHIFTKDEAYRQSKVRETDRPWLKDYIDARARLTFDVNDLPKNEAARDWNGPHATHYNTLTLTNVKDLPCDNPHCCVCEGPAQKS